MNADISGVLCVDKPQGITSHDIIYKVRRLYGTKKVGHTGTLDPLATGVLVVMIGRTAKAAEYISEGNKHYIAGIKLGIATDTEDITGNVLKKCDKLPNKEEFFAVANSFLGKSEQIPPMYSAIKVGGRKLCNMARKGIEIEREGREITIESITAEVVNEENGEYTLDIVCSKGTYIRTVCADIGKKLGCGAVMSSLRRVASGGFDLSVSYTPEQLEAMSDEQKESILLPTEKLFDNLPKVTLRDFFAHLAHCGCEIYLKKIGMSFDVGTRVSLYDKDGFFAVGEVGEYEEGLAVKPIKHFRLGDVSAE